MVGAHPEDLQAVRPILERIWDWPREWGRAWGVPLFTLAPIRQLTSAIASQDKGDLSAAVIATVLESLAGVSLAKQPRVPGDK